jgi:hypothetical protein
MAELVHNDYSLPTCHSSPVSLPQEKHSGCCCKACISAPRLVRRANGGGNYARWLDCATEELQDAGTPETRAQVSTSLGWQHMRPGPSLVFVPCKDAELVSTLGIRPLRCFNAHQHDEVVLCAQRALRQQQAALAKRIAEGRSDGRSRRRLLRKERLVERMRKEREEHTRRRQMVKVCITSRRIMSVRAAVVLLTCSHVLLMLGAAAQNNEVTVRGAFAAALEMHLCLAKGLSLKLRIMDEQVLSLVSSILAGRTCGIPAVSFLDAILVQEALARQQEQEAEAEEAQRLAQDLTERLRELRESRERRRQAMHA